MLQPYKFRDTSSVSRDFSTTILLSRQHRQKRKRGELKTRTSSEVKEKARYRAVYERERREAILFTGSASAQNTSDRIRDGWISLAKKGGTTFVSPK